jgi:hypothetical protein
MIHALLVIHGLLALVAPPSHARPAPFMACFAASSSCAKPVRHVVCFAQDNLCTRRAAANAFALPHDPPPRP